MANTEENMEERILQAAENVFMRNGFAKTTTAQIAKEAGCNQALVHYYYRTKDNLFNKVFQLKINLILDNLTSLFQTDSSMNFVDKVCMMAEVHFEHFVKNADLVPFVVVEFVTNPERFRQLFESKIRQPRIILFEKIEKEMKEEIEKGNIAHITFVQLLQDVISLNGATLLMRNVIQQAFSLSDEATEMMIHERKKEISRIIRARLRP